MSRQPRDPEIERQERERFIVLLHVYNLTWRAFAPALPIPRLADTLALRRDDAEAIVSLLLHHALVRAVGGGGAVEVAPRGVEYVEHLAGRRRSLRLMAGS